MSAAARIEISPASDAEVAAIPALAAFAPSGGSTCFVARPGSSTNETPCAAALLDPIGAPPTERLPRIHLWLAETDGDSAGCRLAELEPLIRAAADAARRLGAERVVLAWDTMDALGQRTLGSFGFRPAGGWPYFPLGGGGGGHSAVEHVMGYRDPVGSLVDLIMDIDPLRPA